MTTVAITNYKKNPTKIKKMEFPPGRRRAGQPQRRNKAAVIGHLSPSLNTKVQLHPGVAVVAAGPHNVQLTVYSLRSVFIVNMCPTQTSPPTRALILTVFFSINSNDLWHGRRSKKLMNWCLSPTTSTSQAI